MCVCVCVCVSEEYDWGIYIIITSHYYGTRKKTRGNSDAHDGLHLVKTAERKEDINHRAHTRSNTICMIGLK